jgi:hypothetical protein
MCTEHSVNLWLKVEGWTSGTISRHVGPLGALRKSARPINTEAFDSGP